MTPLETFEQIFHPEIYTIQSMVHNIVDHDPTNKTFTLTYTYDKAKVLSIIDTMKSQLDTYVNVYMTDELADGAIQDCILWLRRTIEELESFYNMLED